MVDALTRLPPSAVPVMFTVWPGLTWFEETRCCRTTAVLDVTRMVCFFPPRSFTIQVSLLIETTSPMTAEVSAPSPDAPGPPLQAWGSRRPERHRLPPGCQRPTGSPRTSDLPSSRDPGRRACLRRRGAEVPLHLGAGQEDECRCEKTRQHEAATRAPVGLGHPLLVETILIGSRSVSGEATWFGLAGRCFGRTWVGHVHLVLLVAKGVDGSQRRGPVGGVQTEEHDAAAAPGRPVPAGPPSPQLLCSVSGASRRWSLEAPASGRAPGSIGRSGGRHSTSWSACLATSRRVNPAKVSFTPRQMAHTPTTVTSVTSECSQERADHTPSTSPEVPSSSPVHHHDSLGPASALTRWMVPKTIRYQATRIETV